MEELLAPIIFILVFVFIFLFLKLREFYRDRSLRYLVGWSVSTDNHIRCNISLSAYILNAQIKLSLPQEHRISGSVETDYMKEILAEYQRDLSQSYFKGHLKVIKSKYAVSGEHYFMYTLQRFLEGHQCDYEFLGHDMRKKRLEYKRYGDWGGPLYDSTYSLTDFAIVYHKLYYIAYLFCKNSKITNPNGDTYQDDEFLKEILDTQQIQISRF